MRVRVHVRTTIHLHVHVQVGVGSAPLVAREMEQLLVLEDCSDAGRDGDDTGATALAEAMRDASGAVRCLHAARMAECAACIVSGDAVRGGNFLRALARGLDHSWPPDARVRAFAASLREALEDVLGSAACAAELLQVAAAAAGATELDWQLA